ncbi:MAG: LysR family transcriptional regulator [Nocardiopsaceae bacterium]|jgi:DNA-binding transcriptional LysR family regulator|nr:LysR family transcriptional regulator [Nocardiopsaceae bacterium]
MAEEACPGSDAERSLASDSLLRPTFTLEQIRTFLIVASREHITQAARVLGLSQPAVTQQMQLLERALGVPLLTRSGRGVRLTGAGGEIAGACLVVMRALENLESTVRSIRELDGGELTMGASQIAASYYLSPALAAFSATYPAVAVDLAVAPSRTVCEQVSAGALEFGLVDGPLPKRKLDCARVASDEVVLAVHPDHSLAAQEHVSPENLTGSSYLTCEGGGVSTAVAARLLGPAFREVPKVRLANLEAVRQMLLATPSFIAAVPRIAISADLDTGTLVTVGRRPVIRPVFAIRRRGEAQSPAAQAFWAVLASSLGTGASRAATLLANAGDSS